MIITAELLRKHAACDEQVAIFEQRWPEGAEVTRENLVGAAALGMPLDWFERLLRKEQRKAYNEAVAPARKAYNDAIDSAEKAHKEAVAPARKAYNDAIDSAEKAHKEAIAPALKAYNDASASARKAYYETIDSTEKAYDEAIINAILDAVASKSEAAS